MPRIVGTPLKERFEARVERALLARLHRLFPPRSRSLLTRVALERCVSFSERSPKHLYAMLRGKWRVELDEEAGQ